MTNECRKFKLQYQLYIHSNHIHDTRPYTTFSYFIQTLTSVLNETHIKKKRNLKRIISITAHSI